MAFDHIIGQHRVIRLLRQALIQGHLPHALLFTGMDGIGKRLMAVTLAKALNCQDGTPGDCCNRCRSCRKAASGNHPDISIIESEGPFIKIEQIRALQQRLRFRPLEGRCRVNILCNAQQMKAEAANALLKVLEEPPPENLIILTAFETTGLLPTIVSRCLHLRFQPLTGEEIASYLRQVHGEAPERADAAARLAGGSLSRALDLLDEQQLVRRRCLLETLGTLHRMQATELLGATKAWISQGADLGQDLEWVKTWTRDLLVHHLQAAGSEGFLNSDCAEEVKAAAPRFRPDQLLDLFDFLCLLQEGLRYNINKRLTVEAFLFFWRSLATGEESSGSPVRELGKLSFAGSFYG